MKKLLLIAGIPLAVLLFIVYCWLTPVIDITMGKPSDPDSESYVSRQLVSYSEKLGLPMPSYLRKQLNDFTERNNDVEMEIHDNYQKPIRVEATVELKNKQTIVTYSGTVTDSDGKELPYNKQLVFDYVFTEDIP